MDLVLGERITAAASQEKAPRICSGAGTLPNANRPCREAICLIGARPEKRGKGRHAGFDARDGAPIWALDDYFTILAVQLNVYLIFAQLLFILAATLAGGLGILSCSRLSRTAF